MIRRAWRWFWGPTWAEGQRREKQRAQREDAALVRGIDAYLKQHNTPPERGEGGAK